jgi:hypothetical protein
MPRSQKRCGASRVMSFPSTSRRPEATACRPAIALISVDFPAPFGPTTTTSSPASIRRRTLLTAAAAP